MYTFITGKHKYVSVQISEVCFRFSVVSLQIVKKKHCLCKATLQQWYGVLSYSHTVFMACHILEFIATFTTLHHYFVTQHLTSCISITVKHRYKEIKRKTYRKSKTGVTQLCEAYKSTCLALFCHSALRYCVTALHYCVYNLQRKFITCLALSHVNLLMF